MAKIIRNLIKHTITYIPWHKMPKYNVQSDKFTEIIKSLDKSKRFREFYTKKEMYQDGSWIVTRKGLARHLYMKKDGEYIHYWTHLDEKKNYEGRPENTGKKAIQTVKTMFEERNGITLKKAFGYAPIDIKLICSPKQFYYTNDKLMDPNKDLLSVSMADFTSHYPASAAGDLPDWHTAMEGPGTVKPSKEYPFAFYIKSGHVAEYGVFDTHDWVNHKLFDRLFVLQDEYKGKILVHLAQKPLTNPNSDCTILCKSSKYHLGDIYQELYEKRKENEEFKNAMNKSIGYMATCTYKSYQLAHIRAIILGRANAKMLEVADKIGTRIIIQICVDGVAYLGSKVQGIDNKILGTLHQEFTGAKARFSGLNSYIIEKDGKIIKVKHSCYNACEGNGDIDNPTSLDDIKLWYRTAFIEETEDE